MQDDGGQAGPEGVGLPGRDRVIRRAIRRVREARSTPPNRLACCGLHTLGGQKCSTPSPLYGRNCSTAGPLCPEPWPIVRIACGTSPYVPRHHPVAAPGRAAGATAGGGGLAVRKPPPCAPPRTPPPRPPPAQLPPFL